MTIVTKYNIGESVFFIDDSEVVNMVICNIHIKVDNMNKSNITYEFGKTNPVLTKKEDRIFKNTADLISSIDKKFETFNRLTKNSK
jgi:hypothetical protein